jgi:hypothetical protein
MIDPPQGHVKGEGHLYRNIKGLGFVRHLISRFALL